MARACDICGSRKWRRDKVTGNAVCEEGHVQQDYRSEVHDVDVGAGPRHQLTRRRAAGKGERRNKRREEGRANPLFYHGSEAEYLRIQALQLLLRLQVQAISRLWSLPNVYEMIVRDLWSYQLSLSALSALPDEFDRSDRGLSPLLPNIKQSQSSQSRDIEMTNTDQGREDGKSDNSPSGSGSDSDEENEKGDEYDSEKESNSDLDPEILEQIEGSDKEEDLDHMDDGENGENRDFRSKRKKRLRISDTIITLVMGLWILRIPVMGADIENAINEMQIPYIDFYNTTHISEEMRKHMNRDVMISLSPLRSPSPSLIHRSCKTFARILDRKYGIRIPEMNIHPVIWRIISCLGGTPTIYTQVHRLLTLLDINFSLLERDISTFYRRLRSKTNLRNSRDDDSEVEDEERKMETYERTLLYQDIAAPEVAIAAAWIVVMKITYGLEGIPREALLSSDPAIGLPTSKKWVEELRGRLNNGTFKGGQKDLEKQPFNAMDEDDMDVFLSKAEKVLLRHRDEPKDAAPFPLVPSQAPPPSIPPNSWTNFHSNIAIEKSNQINHTPIKSDKGINKLLPLMPGEKILSYPSSSLDDQDMELPSDLEVVLKSSSELIGWNEKELLDVVELYERRLERLRPRDERGRKPREDDDDEDGVGGEKGVSGRRSRSKSISGRIPQSRESSRAPSRSRSRTSNVRMGSRESSVTRNRNGTSTPVRSRESSLSKVASKNNLSRTTSGNRSREPSLSRTASLNRTNSQIGKARGGGLKNSQSFS